MEKQKADNGQVVLVTGAGRGLGLEIGRAFAASGARVIFNYLSSRETAEKAVQEILDNGGQALACQADVSNAQDVERLFSTVQSAFGQLDVLINNAGTYPTTPLLDLKPEDWDAVITSNLRSTFLCTQAAARMMKTQSGGAIINIASIEGSFPADQHAHYAAAKAGVIHFTKTAAHELGAYNIRVNAVSPGLINRPGLEQDWPDGVERWRSSNPLSRLGTPQDIAQPCIFLASAAASWITGINLVVDGGASTIPAF
ncbi:MAG: 3-oxoacyl-ACP reductase family protein [Chloroflexota bacterium]